MIEIEQETVGDRVAVALQRRGMSRRRLIQVINDQRWVFQGDPFQEEELLAFMEGELTLDTTTVLVIAEALCVAPNWIQHGGVPPAAIEEDGDPLLATMTAGLYDRYGSLISVLHRIELAAIARDFLKAAPGGVEALGKEADAIANNFVQALFHLVRTPATFFGPPDGEGERTFMKGMLIALKALVPAARLGRPADIPRAVYRMLDAARWKLQAPDLRYEEWQESQRDPDPNTVVWD